MIPILFLPYQRCYNTDVQFRGKSDLFWKSYNREMKGIPLKDTIIKSISDEKNLLGEGLSKKGYNFAGLKDYVIRIYKRAFKKEDLEKEFIKPDKNYLNTLEGIVLSIPGKIDIVEKKTGLSLGVENYAERIQVTDFPPLRDVCVTRDETLKSLNIYEQLKDFPIQSYRKACLQMKRFCKKPGFQFDIISPNNILIDTRAKKINLIDPVSPEVNKPVHGDAVDFSKYHGCDSLYPILCDFLMQKEHLNNLTPEEKLRWTKAINTIIAKCIYAGKMSGFDRNIDRLKILYNRITKFWTTNELTDRYNGFLEMYSGSINPDKTIKDALDYKKKEQERINAIMHLDAPDFKEIQPVFEKILAAPHQPKVEFPEVLNAALDKILEYGKAAQALIPSLEALFNKEIFYPTKKRLYNLFINLQPDNNKFLSEISKSANNPLEKTLYIQEFEALHQSAARSKPAIKRIYEASTTGERLPQELADKLWISRTCTNATNAQKISINNMMNGYSYIELKRDKKPNTANLIELHKIVLADIPGERQIAGKLRTPDTDELVKQIFHITKDTKKTVSDYSDSKDVINDLKKLEEYIDKNYAEEDPFIFAANIFSGVIKIHPFVNGNGRAARLFTEQVLLSKGYRLTKWAEEVLYRKLYSAQQLAGFLRQNAVKENG